MKLDITPAEARRIRAWADGPRSSGLKPIEIESTLVAKMDAVLKVEHDSVTPRDNVELTVVAEALRSHRAKVR